MYRKYADNVTQPWLVADGAGANKLTPADYNISLYGSVLCPSLHPNPKRPYVDLYAYRTLGAQSQPWNTIIYELKMRYASGIDYDAAQAFEFETHLQQGGKIYNTGVQAAFKETGTWRIFNFQSKKWVDTKIALPLKVDWVKGMNIVAVWQREEYSLGMPVREGVYYDGLSINGTWVPISTSMPVVATDKPDLFNMAWQLDGNKEGSPQSVYITKADVQIL